MANTHVGKTVTIKQGNLRGQTGVVTYQRNDGAVMVKVNGVDEGYAPEMVGLPRIDATAPAWINAIAYHYNVGTDTVRTEYANFLQSEGCFETAKKVVECQTFETWMKLATAKLAYRIEEPYQKSDLGL